MATVFRAYQPSIGRFVAVKVIHRAIASDTRALERFQREARLIARLEHPHLLPVYDYDGVHEPPYIVMRYLEGGTLKDVSDQGSLPLVDTSYLMRQIASALDYAHRQGVIHRDIKPSNIMIDQDGNAFLMDFGIARLAASTSEGLTQTGFAVGTPGYMAPEQGMGMDNIDQRADIYSLGVMVYQMIAGEMPYSAETPLAIVMKHINDPVPSIRRIKPELPELLDEAIAKAMAKKPDDRWSNATDFADEITRAVGKTTVSNLRPDTLKAAAKVAYEQIQQRRAAHQSDIDVTMREFEDSRSSLTRAKSGQTPPPTRIDPSPAAPSDTKTQIVAEEDYPTTVTPSEQKFATATKAGAATPSQVEAASAVPSPSGKSRLPLIIGGVVAVVAVLAILAVVLSGALNPGPSAESQTSTSAAITQIAVFATGTFIGESVNGTATSARATGLAAMAAENTSVASTRTAASDTNAAQQTANAASAGESTMIAQTSAALTNIGNVSPANLTQTEDASQPTVGRTGEATQSRPTSDANATQATPQAQVQPTDTLIPTIADTPTRTFTPPPTDTPLPTETPILTPFAIPARPQVVRLGPGNQYPPVGQVDSTMQLTILGVSEDLNWYLVLLPDGTQGWVASNPAFVDSFGPYRNVPLAEAPTNTPIPTDTPSNTPQPSDTPVPSDTPTNTPIPTDTPSNTPQPTSTLIPTGTPTFTATFTDIPTATIQPSDTPVPPRYVGSGACADNNLVAFIVTNEGGDATADLGYTLFLPDGQSTTGIIPPLASGETTTIEYQGSQAGPYLFFTADSAITVQAICLATPEPTVPPTTEATPTPSAPPAGSFPYLNDFESPDALNEWDYDPAAWQVATEGSEHFLVGQGSLRQPAIVMGRGNQPWVDVNNIIVSFRIYLDPQAVGARLVFQYDPDDANYHVLEMFPGLISLKRNNPVPDLYTRESERILQTTSAPLRANEWYEIRIIVEGTRITVFLDGLQIMSVNDTFQPTLDGGQIMFQTTSQTRPIRFDDLLIQQVLTVSTSFDAGVIPDNWHPNDTAVVTVENDGGTNYLRLANGGNATLMTQGPLTDFSLQCIIWSENGGYSIGLRETSEQGSVGLIASGGNLDISRFVSGEGTPIGSVPNFYNRGRWELLLIEFIGNTLTINRDGVERFSQEIPDAPTEGYITFYTPTSDDILRIDSCIVAAVQQSASELTRPIYAARDLALSRPWRFLRSDFDELFDEIFRTDDYWVDGQQADGTFSEDLTVAEHQRFLRMEYQGRPTFRLMRDVMGVEVFESGNSLERSTDVYTSVFMRFPNSGEAGTAWLGVRVTPSMTGADLDGYRLELVRGADGTTNVRVRYIDPVQQLTLYEGPAPLPADGTPMPEWIPVEVLALDELVAFFVNGQLVYAIDDSQVWGGTVALGVDEGTSADFDTLIIRDSSPHDE
jgi:serine/threonine protein kinase/uncharacterized protein YraI